MKLRLATLKDLPRLKATYGQIIAHMIEQHIQIWDDVYPCEIFSDDIESGQLYILEENGEILSAFALCGSDAGAECVKWEDDHASALYLNRLGVGVNCLRRGIGGAALDAALALAKDMGAEYLRLFVADVNQPAIDLYLKKGFRQADGLYHKIISESSEDVWLHEFGFERKT